MRCSKCGRENSGQRPTCSFCGTLLAGSAPAPVQPVPRFLPAGQHQPVSVFHLCPRCSNPVPEKVLTCDRCHWNLQKPFKPPSGVSCGSCLGSLLLRLAAFGVASGVSFGVGWLATWLGLGGLAANLATGLVSTLLSLAPSVIQWIANSLRRGSALVGILLIAALFTGAPNVPAQAQAYQPHDILQEFIQRAGVEARTWQPSDDPAPSEMVYFAASDNQPDSTNAAQVAYLQDVYGATGGDVWVQSVIESLDQECSASTLSFHDLHAYAVHCDLPDNIQAEMILWGMGPWGAAAFDFIAQDPDYPARDLAEVLYTVMEEMVGEIDQPMEPPAQEEAAQPGSSLLSDEQRTGMAVGVLTDLARQIGGEEPIVIRLGETDVPSSREKTIFVCDSQAIQNEDQEYLCSTFYPGRSFDGDLAQIRRVNGALYHLYYILERSDSPASMKTMFAIIVYAPDRALLEKMLYMDGDYQFHGMPANLSEGNSANIRWYSEPWLFILDIANNPATPIAFDQEHELFYELTRLAGFYSSPPAQENEPVVPPDSMEELWLPLEGAGAMIPAATLPALAVTGLALLIDLARLARGKPGAPAQVSAEVAAAQQELARRGYVYDPATRTFQAANVPSPVDGSPVSPQQAAHEQRMLDQGYVYDPVNGGFVPRDWQNQRQQRRDAFNENLEQKRDAEMNRLREEKERARQEAIRQQRAKVEKLEAEAQANQVKPIFTCEPSAEAGYAGGWDAKDKKREVSKGVGAEVTLVDSEYYDAEDVEGKTNLGGQEVAYKGDVQAGKFQAGVGAGYDKKSGKYSAGVFAEGSSVQLTGEGVVGDENFGTTGDIQIDVAKFDGFAGYRDGSVGASAGASLVSLEGGAGVNVAGLNVGVRGGISVGFELGFTVGKTTEIKLGPFKVGLSFGAAKASS